VTDTLTDKPVDCICTWHTYYINDGLLRGQVVYALPGCPAWPHAEIFLTLPHRPDKVDHMPTTKTQTVYLSTPDLYEHDLRTVIQLIDELKLALERCDEIWLEKGEITVWSKNDYPIGSLALDDDQWVFTPTNESDVEANVDVV
jgi:hypothetical protein